MAQKIGQQGDVIVLLQEVLGEQMPEGMWVDYFRVDPVSGGKFFQAQGYPARRKPAAFGIEEQETAASSFLLQLLERFLLQFLCEV